MFDNSNLLLRLAWSYRPNINKWYGHVALEMVPDRQQEVADQVGDFHL